ncbi:MAG TPA: sigma-70 family RNA polymerase sigma factor [Phycisphaerae bacterium]|nr:sigma-70 family RNA polymerase sigma factor [Phycisphaerae bacterium]
MEDRLVKAAGLAIPFEDAELVEQSRQGDVAAFGRLVVKYQDQVFNTCWRMCGDRAEAEDLAQEAFVRAFRSIRSFCGRAKFSTWVFRIAVNLAISARRKTKGRSTYSLDEGADRDEGGGARSVMAGLAAEEAAPEQRVMDREQQGLVLKALAELDEEPRAVIVLRDVEFLGYDEIAEILEIPAGTVKSRLHRARLALREKLSGILGMV